MSTADRRPYLSATSITQDFLNACADNLTNQLELACDIETPTGTIYVSDRHKYVGNTFYEALVKFPVIERTVGEWLSGELEFSTLTIELSNVDGRFDSLLPGGSAFGSWLGKDITVKLGLRDVDSTYRVVFKGRITDIGGFKRNVKSITLIARERFDTLRAELPNTYFSKTVFPFLENNYDGTPVPLVYGDWSVNLPAVGGVLAYPTNGEDPDVYNDGGLRNPVTVVVASNVLQYLDAATIFLKRGTDAYPVHASDITSVAVNKNAFSVLQNTGNTRVEDANFLFATGDQFIVRVRGENIAGGDNNILAQARHILKTFGGALETEFSTKWAAAETRVSSISSRCWIQEKVTAIQYVASLLEQVRMEPFVDATQKLSIVSLWWEDMEAAPAFEVRNWDLERGSLSLSVDERNNFNRAQGAYNYDPVSGENRLLTKVYKNDAAIAQVGKAISKQISLPNLHVAADAQTQIIEILRLASATPELVGCTITWRGLLQDVGSWVKLDVSFGSVKFVGVPCLIRSVGYDPAGIKLPMLLWSFQQTPFSGWAGQGAGIVGGYAATITFE